MKLAFAGTPAFAATTLAALLDAGHELPLVLTQPDRPAGRGLKPHPSAVKQLAQSRGLALAQPAKLDEAALAAVREVRPEALVVAAYGLIVPAALLRLPPRGCVNVHASLLPRWRGAAPIQRALLAGDAETGITIMQMDEDLDTGAILLQQATPIASDDTAGSLHDRLAALGAQLVVRALAESPPPRPQENGHATYAKRISKEEAEIEWSREAREIERQVRAFDPTPGAGTQVAGTRLKIWRARVEPGVSGEPGVVLAAGPSGVVVACGREALRLTEMQRAGGRRLGAGEFLAGFSLRAGARLGAGHA